MLVTKNKKTITLDHIFLFSNKFNNNKNLKDIVQQIQCLMVQKIINNHFKIQKEQNKP
jgi:hypothetical protein